MTGTSTPIEDYALIGDLHTAALVARTGSIDWLCLPKFDSPACFAAMLDTERAGRWLLAPSAGGTASTREYVEDSLVLRSSWKTPDGAVDVVDLMPPRGDAADLVRIVTGVSGRVEMHTELAPRFDYGSVVPWVIGRGREVRAIAGPDSLWLRSDVPVEVDEGTISATFDVSAGEEVTFVLTHRPAHAHDSGSTAGRAQDALRDTKAFWKDWLARCRYQGRWQQEVRRSLVVLKALTYAPTGGIVAAATTSLPEEPGGVRNWDYRFCWLRDASFTLQALLGTGYVEEARAWREWLVRAVAGDPAKLQIMYGVDGRRRLPELELGWLSGYAGSTPVREGNAAAGQFQLDVWGEVLDGLHLARESGLRVDETAWDLQIALLDWLEGNWDRPDNSLWEVRGPRRQFVHSKALAWAGLDRAVHSVEAHGLDGPVDRWRALRDTIHAEICERGFDTERGTFTQFYGSKGIDAALLLLPRVGFLPWEDPRIRGTVAAIESELRRDGFLLRYDPQADGGADGLPGGEGVFLACSFWLVDALAGTGRREEAEALFERLLSLRNDVGLLSEEYDVHHRRLLGNVPQSFSHVGLVNSARQLSGASTRTSSSRAHQGLHGDDQETG